MVAYFECEDCLDGERDALIRLGPVIVPSLAASLRGGPPPASRETLRAHLVDTYAELRTYSLTHPDNASDWSEEQYVRYFAENYVVQYQTRAARALAAIGGPEARAALRQALALPLNTTVLTVVGELLSGGPQS
jgi:hypothetical protein